MAVKKITETEFITESDITEQDPNGFLEYQGKFYRISMTELATLVGIDRTTQVNAYIQQWIDEHPEDVAFIKNGSISIDKLNSDLVNYLAKETEVDVERKRIDSLIAGGEITGDFDAEVADARMHWDGTVSTSLGTAIRTQFSTLKEDFNSIINGGGGIPQAQKTNFAKAIRQELVFVSTSHPFMDAFLAWLESGSDTPVIPPTPEEPDEPTAPTLTSITVTWSAESADVGTDPKTLIASVKANYSDGSSQNITGYTVSPASLAEGANTVTVSYNGKTAEKSITGLATESGIDIAKDIGWTKGIRYSGNTKYANQNAYTTSDLFEVSEGDKITFTAKYGANLQTLAVYFEGDTDGNGNANSGNVYINANSQQYNAENVCIVPSGMSYARCCVTSNLQADANTKYDSADYDGKPYMYVDIKLERGA